MDEYLTYIINEYVMATNTNHIDLESDNFLKEISLFISDRQNTKKTYLEFLKKMKIRVNKYNYSLELGKGRYDTLVKDELSKNFNIIALTKYTKGLEKEVEKKIVLPYEPIIISGKVYAKKEEDNKLRMKPLKTDNLEMVMIQNPYTKNHYRSIEKIHNKSDVGIVVGVYGNIYDKDRDLKAKQLLELKNKLNTDYKEDYYSNNGEYCYVLTSKKLIKRKK